MLLAVITLPINSIILILVFDRGGKWLSSRSYCLIAGEIAPVAAEFEAVWTPELVLSIWSKEVSLMEI